MTPFVAAALDRPTAGASYETFSAPIQKIVSEARGLRMPASPNAMSQDLVATSLAEQLFEARANAKILLAQVAMHIGGERRKKIFSQLDSLHDVDEWEEGDEPLSRASFECFLRVILDFAPVRLPSFGLSFAGNLLAAWTHPGDTLTMEFMPRRRIRWSVARVVDGERELAAGETLESRLHAALGPYDPQHWLKT